LVTSGFQNHFFKMPLEALKAQITPLLPKEASLCFLFK
jgi:hypothetical protein